MTYFPPLFQHPKPIFPPLPGWMAVARPLELAPWEERSLVSRTRELAVCGALVVVAVCQALDELRKQTERAQQRHRNRLPQDEPGTLAGTKVQPMDSDALHAPRSTAGGASSRAVPFTVNPEILTR